MPFTRIVIYEVAADTLEEALELWEDEGPKTGDGVIALDSSQFEQVEPTGLVLGDGGVA